MKIGVPKEIKNSESRVALIPGACAQLIALGHEIVVEAGCGLLTGYVDKDYLQAGCKVVGSLEHVYLQANMIVKVKEPQQVEYALIKSHHILFCYLHLAAESKLVNALKQTGCIAIAFEEVTDEKGDFPLLKPMSMVAGKLSAQYASTYIHCHHSGRGILVDGIAGAEKAKVTVLGYGVAGSAAAEHFNNLGAALTIIDKDERKLSQAKQLGGHLETLNAMTDEIGAAVKASDIIIGAVLVSGARAPIVVKEEWVRNMQEGSVIIDIAVDQGGCVATTRPTTYQDPIFVLHDVIHFAVQNMPAAVPRTASQLLSNAILPSVISIAANDWRTNSNILAGLCIESGELV